jgi:hypothetical protein
MILLLDKFVTWCIGECKHCFAMLLMENHLSRSNALEANKFSKKALV